MTPAESGAIGAAGEVPGTAAIAKAATAIAKKMVRIIVVLLRREPPEHKTRNHDGGSAMSVCRLQWGHARCNLGPNITLNKVCDALHSPLDREKACCFCAAK